MKKIFGIIFLLAAAGCAFWTYKTFSGGEKPGTPTYEVAFLVDGSVYTSENVLRGGKPTIPENPEKSGHTFVEWTPNPGDVTYVTENLKFEAVFTVNQYNVAFHTNGANDIESYTGDFGTKVTKPTDPSKAGYDFAGWEYNGALFNFNEDTIPDHDIILSATYTKKEYTLTIHDVEGETFANIVAHYDERIYQPDEPVVAGKEGYAIKWYADSECKQLFSFYRMPAANMDIYGRWELIEAIDASFLSENVMSMAVIDTFEQLVYYIENIVFLRDSNKAAEILEDGIYKYYYEIPVSFSVANYRTVMDNVKKALTIDSQFKVTSRFDEDTNTFRLTFEFDDEAYQSASLNDKYLQLDALDYVVKGKRDDTFDNFKINNVTKAYPVETSEQLFFVMNRGYRPEFTTFNSEAEKMYKAAKNVLRQIIDDNMTDIEKLLAIYEWIIMENTYDAALAQLVKSNDPAYRSYYGFFLEGVFTDNRAVCDGLSKAFTVLARIEGIEMIQVSGISANSKTLHAWNKVRLDNQWYIVDATSGGTIQGDTYEVLNHNFFLITESQMENYYYCQSTPIDAFGAYDYYKETKFTYEDNSYDLFIDSQDELATILKYYVENASEQETFDFKIGYDYGTSINDELSLAIPEGATIKFFMDLDVLVISGWSKGK